jgi:hypothetical protein
MFMIVIEKANIRMVVIYGRCSSLAGEFEILAQVNKD